MGITINAPKQDGNARFNSLKVNLTSSVLATRAVLVDDDGNFFASGSFSGGGGGGTVTTVSIVSANGFSGSVANPTTTPSITLNTTIAGILKGNGTAISAATAGTDYITPTLGTASYAVNAISASYVSGSSAIIMNLTSSNDALINGLTVGRGNANIEGSSVLGQGAGASITTGTFSVLIGYNSGNKITVGGSNTLIGFLSGRVITSGSFNTIIGASAGFSLIEGSLNTFIGKQSGFGITSGSGNLIISSRNTGGVGITTGNYNTVIGNEVGGLTSTLSNNIILADGQGNIKYRWDRIQNNFYDNIVATGSITATQGFTGSLFGTSSWAYSASIAISSSNSLSASYALTSSYAATASSVNVLNQNVQISGSLAVNASGSNVFTVEGTLGSLFSVDDSFSGSLFSVNTISGLPIIEAFSDNTIRIGQYSKKALYISQSFVGIGKETLLNATLDISGSLVITGSTELSGAVYLPAITTTNQTSVVTINTSTGQLYYTASSAIGGGGSGLSGGSTNYVARWASATTLTTGSIYDDGTNVGIGTTAPANKLEISGSNGALLRLRAPGIGNNYILYSSGSTDLGYVGYGSAVNNGITVMNYQNDVLNLGTNNAVVATISGSNFGIGITLPTATLTVSKAASNFMFDLENATETGFKLRTYNSGSSGAGTAVFTQGLYYTTNENGAIKFHRGSGGTDGFLTFSTSATERVRIDVNGNVGIGINNPSTKLHVTGSTAISVDGSSQDTSPYAPLGVTRANTASNLSYIGMTKTGVIPWGIGISSNSSNSSLIVGPVTANTQVIAAPIMSWNYTNQRVGINTTASAGNLHVYDINDPASTLVGQVQIGGNNTISNDIYLSIGTHKTGEYAFLNAAKGGIGSIPLALMGGNVGILTTTPSSSLHINNTNSNGVVIGTVPGNVGTLQLVGGVSSSPVSSRLMFGTDGTGWQFRIAKNQAGTISDLVTIEDTGNIGIAKTTPLARLHVSGNILSDVNDYAIYSGKKNAHLSQNAYFDGAVWKSYGSAASYGAAVLFQTDAINSRALNILVDTSISAADEFLTFTGTPLLAIKTTGETGIGVAPGTTYKLEVGGSVGATAYYETSDITKKTILETNPEVVLDLDVIKFIRKDDPSNDVRYGYSAQQVRDFSSDLINPSGELSVKYVDIHTLKIASLEKRVSELEQIIKKLIGV